MERFLDLFSSGALFGLEAFPFLIWPVFEFLFGDFS